jgi:hypothetical protein
MRLGLGGVWGEPPGRDGLFVADSQGFNPGPFSRSPSGRFGLAGIGCGWWWMRLFSRQNLVFVGAGPEMGCWSEAFSLAFRVL